MPNHDKDDPNLIRRTVAQMVLFKDIPPADLDKVIAKARLRHAPDGGYFFMVGDPASGSYALVTGKVRLTQVSSDGQTVLLGYLSPGREFGILSGLGEMKYPVSAQAVGDSSALMWDNASFAELMDEFPRITRNALFIMSRQVREFQMRIRELSTQRVERRIARNLLRLAQQSGKSTREGILIDLPLSRQDLAEMSGTTLYTVSRTLSRWEELGFVHSGRERVVVAKPEALVALTDELDGAEAF